MTRKDAQREEDLHLEAAIAEMVAVETGRQALSFPESSVPMDKPDIAGMRKRLGYTQEGLAKVLGIPVATLRNWEQGRRRPNNSAMLLLRLIELAPQREVRPAPNEMEQIDKDELVSAVIDAAGVSKTEARSAVEAVIDTIASRLERSGAAAVAGFGSFFVRPAAVRNRVDATTERGSRDHTTVLHAPKVRG